MCRTIESKESSALDTISTVLMNGELVIMPCDTIYGIVGKVDESLNVLKYVKGREETKPFIQLMTLQMAQSLSTTLIQDDILSLWPGPLTVIVQSKQHESSVAIRVPNDPLLLSIIENIGSPVYSSSVNISGEPTLHDFKAMQKRFANNVSLYVKKEDDQGTVASTILDIRTSPYTLIRSGAQDISSLHNVRSPSELN